MKVLVTAATGFMGGLLCAALVGAGEHGLRAFVLRGLDASGLPPAFEVAYGDVTDVESLVAVSHAAAAVEPWRANPSVFHTVHAGGLKNVLKAAHRTPTGKKIVYTSSYLAIGPTDGYVADETQHAWLGCEAPVLAAGSTSRWWSDPLRAFPDLTPPASAWPRETRCVSAAGKVEHHGVSPLPAAGAAPRPCRWAVDGSGSTAAGSGSTPGLEALAQIDAGATARLGAVRDCDAEEGDALCQSCR
ncbi:putative dihydroflavonol-4-reductase [Panicum miliaceum]|uniref:Dihydroflavonol-4-reductase n=1 Tax=Panicum miliaceum TaxID=4540 RepID=A0A3L6TKJ2_PANMI|nr:putative dihydroflavonol-4-reductase [Panicum miliaceum]